MNNNSHKTSTCDSLPSGEGFNAKKVGVRQAEFRDIPSLCQVQSNAMLAGLNAALGQIPQVAKDALCAKAMIGPWTEALNDPDPASMVLVSFEGQAITGMGAFSAASSLDIGGLGAGTQACELLENPADAEISALEVDPAYSRRGHGSRLLAALTDLLHARGVHRVQTWILSQDKAKLHFFESAGFSAAPIRRALAVGDQLINEQCWYTDL